MCIERWSRFRIAGVQDGEGRCVRRELTQHGNRNGFLSEQIWRGKYNPEPGQNRK